MAQRDGKYTQGFVFEQGPLNGSYARAVVERSCAAVLTLLQDVFTVAEKNAFQKAAEQSSVQEQNRIFKRLADMIRHRSLLEKSMVTAVVCAYAEIGGSDNDAAIAKRIAELEKLRCEKLDLVALLGVDAIRDQVTNRTRPLLFDLNAQINLLFAHQPKKYFCNPLSPATLIGGFVAGLLCADMDILAKQRLFRTFEQEFLSRLSVLLNSVILRLDQENTFEKRVVGFNDKNAGPIEQILQQAVVLPLAELQQAIDVMHQSLSAHKHFHVAQGLYELSAEDSVDSMVTLLSDVRYHYHVMRAVELRGALNVSESHALIEARRVIAEQLNAALSGKSMPAAVKVFLETLWPNVLFDVLMTAGDASENWRDALQLQQLLLESVKPVHDAEKLTALNRMIPGVVRALRKLLDEAGCRFEDIAAFMGELKLLHLQNMQQKLDANTFVAWKEIALRDYSPAAITIFNQDEIICYGQLKHMMSLLSYSSASVN